MQIINLKEKLQTELNYFNEEKPYTHFFIDYGQPSQMSCKLVPSENDTIFINIVQNASYNIGARYFIRHLLKTVTATQRLALEAKVPQVTKRSTCTLSDLINLRSEFVALVTKTQAWVVWSEKEVCHWDEAETAEPDGRSAIQTQFGW